LSAYGLYISSDCPKKEEKKYVYRTPAPFYVNRVVGDAIQKIPLIPDEHVRKKVSRFMQRFNSILEFEIEYSSKNTMLRPISLTYDDVAAYISWTFVNYGAGFVFESDGSSFYFFESDGKRVSSTSGSLDSNTCADSIRDVIRHVIR
jgi:hypothetical protein